MQEVRRRSAALMTIGYEGAAIDDFVATLQQAGIEVLVDIREIPVSRKHGFSKKLLAKALDKVSIQYIHLRELGDPKAGREAAKQGETEKFERIFRSHLARVEAQEALNQAIEIAIRHHAVLLCFEKDYKCCHRSIVAEEIAKHEHFNIHHLNVIPGLSSKERRFQDADKSAYAFG